MSERIYCGKISNWNHKVIHHLNTADIGISELKGCDFGIIGGNNEGDFSTVHAKDKELQYKPSHFEDGILIFEVSDELGCRYETYESLVFMVKEMAEFAKGVRG